MTLAYRDFVPRRTAQPSGWFWTKDIFYESFDEALESANRWIEDGGVRVLSVETVVLPNIWEEYEEGTTDAALRTSGDSSSYWHQFIRVWYETK
jgi:hypothetical protein